MNREEELKEEIDKNAAKLTVAIRTGLEIRSSFLKGGVEFEKLREYIPEIDSARDIDWKASLRSPNILVREYQVMQKLNMFMIQDSSTSMAYGTGKWTKNQYASIVMGSLIKASLNSQISVGIGFSDPEKGLTDIVAPTRHFGIYKKFLSLALKREFKGKFNFKEVLGAIIGSIDSKSIIIIFSDFLNMEEGWEDELLASSQKFTSVLCFSIRDPMDEDLPDVSKNFRLQDPETGETIVVNLRDVREEYKKEMEKMENALKEKIEKSGATYKKVFTNEPFIKPLIEFMQRV
jgi:uncharacterized protein (DUF58 family)